MSPCRSDCTGSVALCTCIRMAQWVCCTVYVSPYIKVGLLHCVRVSVYHSGSIALCTCLRKSQWVCCNLYVSPYVTEGLLHYVRVSINHSGSIALCTGLPMSKCVFRNFSVWLPGLQVKTNTAGG